MSELRRDNLKRGDLVRVEVHGGDLVWRRVWDKAEVGDAVLITKEESYQEAIASGFEPPMVGFRWQYVKEMQQG